MITLQPQVDGPIKVSGETDVCTADGRLIEHAAELWLCRCGSSSTKPYCDGSHKLRGFRDAAAVPPDYKPKGSSAGAPGPVLKLTLVPNGPLRCFGAMKVEGCAGGAWSGTYASLCRCGQSSNKPFCDGTHRSAGFESVIRAEA